MLDPADLQHAESSRWTVQDSKALDNLFANLDINEDGYITLSELQLCAGLNGDLSHMLDAIDEDHDGNISRTEWDHKVKAYFAELSSNRAELHELILNAVESVATGDTFKESLSVKHKSLIKSRRHKAEWNDVRSDAGSDLDEQDMDFANRDRLLPVGQKLEIERNGVWILFEIKKVNAEDSYPYTLTYVPREDDPTARMSQSLADMKTKACLLDVFHSRVHSPLWLGEKRAPFRFFHDKEEVFEDEVISELLENGELSAKPKQLLSLFTTAREILQEEKQLLELDTSEAGIAIFGDIHGNFHALTAYIKQVHLHPPKVKLLFLGDYVDRGHESIEVLALLLAWKIKYPNHVFLLRGNHEDENINCRYGFEAECVKKYGQDEGMALSRQVNNTFHYMPVAAKVDDELFCCHAGIGPEVKTLDDVRELHNHLPLGVDPTPEQHHEAVLQHLLWADPADPTKRVIGEIVGADGFSPNTLRGVSVKWNEAATDNFLQRNNLKMIVRGHEVKKDGYDRAHNNKVLTIFSAPNYQEQNLGAVFYIDRRGGQAMQYWRLDAELNLLPDENNSGKMTMAGMSFSNRYSAHDRPWLDAHDVRMFELQARGVPEDNASIVVSQAPKSLEGVISKRGVGRFGRFQKRKFELTAGRLRWCSVETGVVFGYLDFWENPCIAEPDEKSQTKFTIRPANGQWNPEASKHTGSDDRIILLETDGTEFNREEWIISIQEHSNFLNQFGEVRYGSESYSPRSLAQAYPGGAQF